MEKKHIALLVLLALAIFTRFFGIEFQSLWVDEGATYYYSHYTWEQFKLVNDPNSLIFYRMVGWCLDTMGHSEFSMRFISAVCGVITVMMSYFVAEKMFKNWRFSILVGVMFLISLFCLQYSQEARGYGPVLMFFMLQFYVFLYVLETKKIIYWILFFLLGAAAFLMQYVAIFATVTLVLYAFYAFYKEKKETGNYKPLLFLSIICIVAIALSYPVWGIAIDAVTSHFYIGEHAGWAQIGPLYIGDVVYHFLSGIPFLAIVLFVLMILGIMFCRKAHRQEYILLMWVMLFPLAFTTILSIFYNMSPRYIIWSLPPYLIFVAMSFYYWGTDKESLKRANVVAVVSVVLVAGLTLPIYYTEPCKSNYRDAAAELNAYAEEGDVVVYCPDWRSQVYGTLSFYYVPEDHGVAAIPYESEQQLVELSKDPNYRNVFVLIEDANKPYDYLLNQRSDTCAEIFSGYTIHLFMITAPL